MNFLQSTSTIGNPLPSINREIDSSLSVVSYSEPISVELAKKYARVTTGTEEDEIIELLITAAREAIEGYCLISLVPKTCSVIFEPYAAPYGLPYGPVTGDVAYVDANDYVVTPTQVGFDFPEVLPYQGRLQATYTCGYTSDSLPKELKTAWLDQITFMYDNRGDNSDSAIVCLKAQATCNKYSRRAIFA